MCAHDAQHIFIQTVIMKFSKLAREIYGRYTDQIEPYGMDECWLDVTGSGCMGTGLEIADEIRRTVKFERILCSVKSNLENKNGKSVDVLQIAAYNKITRK